jgi:hypothetical protein
MGMDVSEELPHVFMTTSFKTQIGKVVQVDFLSADLYSHRHCDVFKPVYESLSDILKVMITENEVDSAI